MQSRPLASYEESKRSSAVPHSIPLKGGAPPQPTAEVRVAASNDAAVLPAPVAAAVIEDLPGWKRQALAAIRYGRFLTTNIVVSAKGAPDTIS